MYLHDDISQEQLLSMALRLNAGPKQALAELSKVGAAAQRLNQRKGYAFLSLLLVALLGLLGLTAAMGQNVDVGAQVALAFCLVLPCGIAFTQAQSYFTKAKEQAEDYATLVRPMAETELCAAMSTMMDRLEAAGVPAVVAKGRPLYGVDYFLSLSHSQALRAKEEGARALEEDAAAEVERRKACATLHARVPS